MDNAIGQLFHNYSMSQNRSRVLARPFPKGTVPFGGSNVPFGSAAKPLMCPLVPLQNQHIFNSHLNYLNLKKLSWLQMFGTANQYIQDDGCGLEILFVSFGL